LTTPPYTPPTPSRTSNTPPLLRPSSLWTVRPAPKPGGAAVPEGHPRPGHGARTPLCPSVRRLPNKHPLTAMGGGDRPRFQRPCALCCCDRVPALAFAHSLAREPGGLQCCLFALGFEEGAAGLAAAGLMQQQPGKG